MNIKNIDPFIDVTYVKEVVQVYQQAFGGAPWNEGYRCPLCNTSFPLSIERLQCSHCATCNRKIPLVEYWPQSSVFSDFYKEMSKPGSLCIGVFDGDVLAGFAWGYTVEVSPHLDEQLDAPQLHHVLSGSYFYLDECAIAPPYQGKGLGTAMAKKIFERFQEKSILLRTLYNSRMYNIVTRGGGHVIQHISGNRVIMVK